MTDSTYCYLHMTSAHIASLDFFDELDERSTIIGRVDDDEIAIPFGAMPPEPDDGDNLPSQIHPSFPYGNPFKDKTLSSAAFLTNPMSTRAHYEDAEFEGIGPKTKRRWKDLGLGMLLPPDAAADDAKAKAAARAAVDTSTTGKVELSAIEGEDDAEEDEPSDEDHENPEDYDLSRGSPQDST